MEGSTGIRLYIKGDDVKDNSLTAWSVLTYEEKNRVLFQQQKKTLDLFLERRAISQEQHDKSLHDLIEKMSNQ